MFSSPSEEKKEDSAYQLIYSVLSLKNQQTLAVPCNKTLNNKTMCWLKGHKVKPLIAVLFYKNRLPEEIDELMRILALLNETSFKFVLTKTPLVTGKVTTLCIV